MKDYLPLVKDGKQQGILPISGMAATEVVNHLPDLKMVEDTTFSKVNIIFADEHPSFHDQGQ